MVQKPCHVDVPFIILAPPPPPTISADQRSKHQPGCFKSNNELNSNSKMEKIVNCEFKITITIIVVKKYLLYCKTCF